MFLCIVLIQYRCGLLSLYTKRSFSPQIVEFTTAHFRRDNRNSQLSWLTYHSDPLEGALHNQQNSKVFQFSIFI